MKHFSDLFRDAFGTEAMRAVWHESNTVQKWRNWLLDSDWEAKSSLRMRMLDTQREIFVPVPNPLRSARGPRSGGSV